MGKDGVKVVMAELTRGDFLGRIPFLDTGLEPHSAEVLVSKDIVTETVDPSKFQAEYDKISTTFKNIIKHISATISVTVQTSENNFGRDFAGSDAAS